MKKATLLFLLMTFSVPGWLLAQNPTIQTIISEVNIDTLLFRAEEISGERGVVVNGVTDTIKSRHKSKPGNELCYDFLIQKLASFGLQTDSLLFGTVGKNALAVQTGMLYPNQYYIVCAHYDDMPNATVAPAADDDGSGVSTVMEAARILSNYQFEYTIIYALWDEEEQGLAGSSAYASLANTNNDSLRGVLNLDAIAFDSDNDNAAMIHTNNNSLAVSVAVDNVNTTYALGLDLTIQNPGATYSDHASFWTNGFPAVLLIEDWTFDSNPNYHTVNDRVMYFNVPYYEKMSKLAVASIATMAVPYTSTSVAEEEKNSYSLYPNPVSDALFIRSDNKYPVTGAEICDISGRVLAQYAVKSNAISLDVSQLPEGLYFVRLLSERGQEVMRFVKK
ncbi:MAG: M28 family peptidase [Bacteroidota bacterium]